MIITTECPDCGARWDITSGIFTLINPNITQRVIFIMKGSDMCLHPHISRTGFELGPAPTFTNMGEITARVKRHIEEKQEELRKRNHEIL